MHKEELRQEIREMIKEELYNIVYKEKAFDKPIISYIRTLIHDEIKYLKMIENGYRPNDSSEFFLENHSISNIVFDIPESIDLRQSFTSLLKKKMINCTYEVFENNLRSNVECDEKINWVHKAIRSKSVNQHTLFDFLYSLDNRIVMYDTDRIKLFLIFVTRAFKKDGEELIPAKLYTSFMKWRSKQR